MNARRARRDAGLSLVEVVIAMSLASVVLATLMAVVIGQVRATSQVTAKVNATADARTATELMARRLRVAVEPRSTVAAFEDVTPNSVTFFASLATTQGAIDPPPTRVTYSAVPVTFNGRATTCLQEVRIPPTGTTPPYTYSAANGVTTCLAHGDLNPSGGALFTYFNDPGGSTTTADPSRIRSVGVSLELRSASGAASATTRAATRVTLPNIRQLQES